MSDEKPSDSQYPKLEKPDIRPNTPQYLLNKMDEKEEHWVTKLSVLEQQNDWIIHALMESNRAIRDIDIRLMQHRAGLELRLQSMEAWQSKVTNKWSVVAAIFIWLTPLIYVLVKDRMATPASHVVKSP